MTKYSSHVSKRSTPQQEQAVSGQVENSASGFVFSLDAWHRLDRFLILGTDGGTFYVDEKKHTKQAAAAVEMCIRLDGSRTVARIVEISDAGRAVKNDPAIFALAMCAGAEDAETRRLALAALPRVCRIGTHLFHFAQDVIQFRGCGRALRTALGRWYTSMPSDKLALQVVKYQQRDGWSHRDILRLAHPKPQTPEHGAIIRWATVGMDGLGTKREKHERDKVADASKLPKIIAAFDEIHSGVDASRAAKLISDHRLPHECVPNELKDQPKIWEAMLPHMGVTALIRSLGKLSSIGLTKPLSATSKMIVNTLTDQDILKAGRVHPMTVLYAMKTYASGRGVKGALTWTAERSIVDAMDHAFYASFGNVEPCGKNIMLALDVSGSMSTSMSNTTVTCREGTAAMAMITARAEKNWMCVGFTSSGHHNHSYGGRWGGAGAGLTELSISPRQRLDDVVSKISNLPFGGTDCSLPMLHAIEKNLEIDVFQIYTDSETWAGEVHPFQALKMYRQKSGRKAKLIVVGMTASEFSIADSSDGGMLDVVGFDTSSPSIMSEFSRS